jgi:hypothetical protein
LIFPRPKREMDAYLPKVKGEDFFQIFSANTQSLAKWFNEYEMDSMKLNIESIINSSEPTKIIPGSKVENSGLTIVLKPEKMNSSNYNHGNHVLHGVQPIVKRGLKMKMREIEKETQNKTEEKYQDSQTSI